MERLLFINRPTLATTNIDNLTVDRFISSGNSIKLRWQFYFRYVKLLISSRLQDCSGKVRDQRQIYLVQQSSDVSKFSRAAEGLAGIIRLIWIKSIQKRVLVLFRNDWASLSNEVRKHPKNLKVEKISFPAGEGLKRVRDDKLKQIPTLGAWCCVYVYDFREAWTFNRSMKKASIF